MYVFAGLPNQVKYRCNARTFMVLLLRAADAGDLANAVEPLGGALGIARLLFRRIAAAAATVACPLGVVAGQA